MASREAADCACQTVKQACGAPVALSLHGSSQRGLEELHAAAEAAIAATPLQLAEGEDGSVAELLRAVRAQPDPRAAVTTALVAVLHVPTRPRLAFPSGRPSRKAAAAAASPAVSPRAAAVPAAAAAPTAEGGAAAAAPADQAQSAAEGGEGGGAAPAVGAKRKAADGGEQLPDGSNYLDPYPSVRALLDRLRCVPGAASAGAGRLAGAGGRSGRRAPARALHAGAGPRLASARRSTHTNAVPPRPPSPHRSARPGHDSKTPLAVLHEYALRLGARVDFEEAGTPNADGILGPPFTSAHGLPASAALPAEAPALLGDAAAGSREAGTACVPARVRSPAAVAPRRARAPDAAAWLPLAPPRAVSARLLSKVGGQLAQGSGRSRNKQLARQVGAGAGVRPGGLRAVGCCGSPGRAQCRGLAPLGGASVALGRPHPPACRTCSHAQVASAALLSTLLETVPAEDLLGGSRDRGGPRQVRAAGRSRCARVLGTATRPYEGPHAACAARLAAERSRLTHARPPPHPSLPHLGRRSRLVGAAVGRAGSAARAPRAAASAPLAGAGPRLGAAPPAGLAAPAPRAAALGLAAAASDPLSTSKGTGSGLAGRQPRAPAQPAGPAWHPAAQRHPCSSPCRRWRQLPWPAAQLLAWPSCRRWRALQVRLGCCAIGAACVLTLLALL